MAILGPAALGVLYTTPLTADELAELELLYLRLNEALTRDWEEDLLVYEYEIISDTFGLYPERVINHIKADCEAAGWDIVEVTTFPNENSTKSRVLPAIQIHLEIEDV